MFRIFSVLALMFAVLVSSGCASNHKHNLDALSVGMDKDDVLRLSGSPWITRRINSQDLWIYRFYKGDQQYRKELRFEAGRLIAIAPTMPHPNPKDRLIEADNLEEYTKAADKQNKSYDKGFKDLTPSDDDD